MHPVPSVRRRNATIADSGKHNDWVRQLAAVTIAHGQPSTLVKWRTSDAALTDTLSLGWEQAQLAIVATSLRVTGTSEVSVVAIVGGNVRLLLLSVSLVALSAATPSVIDSIGGATVSFVGEAFDANTSYWCHLSGVASEGRHGWANVSATQIVSLRRATFVSSMLLTCPAPPSSASGDVCTTSVVELLQHDMATVASNVLIYRPDSVAFTHIPGTPTAIRVTNTSLQTWSASFGPGAFLPASQGSAKCLLRDATGATVSTGNATFVTIREVRCDMPKVPDRRCRRP